MSEFEHIMQARLHVIQALEYVDLILGSEHEDEFNLGADLRDCLKPALRVIDQWHREINEPETWKYRISLGI